MATKLFRPDQVLGEGGFGVLCKGVIDKNMRPSYVKTELEGIQGYREWLPVGMCFYPCLFIILICDGGGCL
ncbi:putative non-specific serine/threonine protein kinase [Helianthus annuus]|nr:putative non-specific serine/threonine protein kinase [Helianthus annuus]